jgi:phenylalanyl-tRNA synthetase beta chain
MKAPLSWLREYAAVPESITVEELENAFVKVGFEVEAIDIQGKGLAGPLVVGRVLEIEELKELKKPIRYVGLDCGEGATRWVICGAHNFAVDDLVVVALPGAVLPGDFAISARETYGKTSNGMICSARELGISDEHSGIIVLAAGSATIGADAIELLHIRDWVVDVAVNPDRGYALSMRGLARELAASLSVSYSDPLNDVDVAGLAINAAGIQISIDDPSAASVAYIRTIDGFDPQKQTPLWMTRRIEKCGMRSISLAVDITNYVMLELGQPLHAFDRSKVAGALHIRRANSDKTIKTLDGQVRALVSEDLLVADEKQPLALAGTMGGKYSEVTQSTTSMAIEAARFNPSDIAKNSRRHKLSSEASRRLERTVDPSLAAIASARAVHLLCELGGANHIGSAVAGEPRFAPVVTIEPQAISRLLGFEISNPDIRQALITVGCDVKELTESSWEIDPPSWRFDLEVLPDFAEEVARTVGYEKIPMRLPTGKRGAALTSAQKRRRSIATLFAESGFSEVYNYPFISQAMLDDLGFVGKRAAAFTIANPMSEDFPLLRTHILPGLLQTAVRNQSRGSKNVALFEIGTIFRNWVDLPALPQIPTGERPSADELKRVYEGVPDQPTMIGGVVLGQIAPSGWWGKGSTFDWSDAIAAVVRIVESAGHTATVHASDFAPWHPGRCAEIRVGDVAVGHAGELHPRVVEKLGLPPRSSAFASVLTAIPETPVVVAPQVWTMPAAVQDVALVVDASVAAADLQSALIEGAGDLLESITLFDRYDKLGDGKVSLAFTMVFRSADRTLTASEVSGFREAAVGVAAKRYGATARV